ncbi:MAG TPA: MBL fold metallo-hydrolase [Gemmatimonadaceae bacterium]|nr:MBL fold metallo-hydrolase [Gemmatimonadaceae bacterium]
MSIRSVAFAALIAACAACSTPSASVQPRFQSGAVPAAWYAGGRDCAGRPDFNVQAYNDGLFILRQAACKNYEKPFIYLIVGTERALLIDTGAGKVDVVTPVDSLVRAAAKRQGASTLQLIVAHSHAHGDHIAGDTQFVGRANTVLVGRDSAAVRAFFNINRWPQDQGTIDLGHRVLDVVAIPGHQPASIAVYDRLTGVLFTGDTFYPGRLYVRDTAAYAQSVARLLAFANAHRVTHFLGAHVENSSTPGVDYPVGTVDQPNEHGLDMTHAQLVELDSVVQTMRGHFVRTIRRDFTVWPQTP